MFVILFTVMGLYDFALELPREKKKFINSKKVLYLVPQTTLMTEETFYKLVKAVTNKLQIIK